MDLKKEILFIFVLLGVTLASVSSFARSQYVVTTRAYHIKTAAGRTLLEIPRGHQMVAKSCDQDTCQIRYTTDDRSFTFRLNRLELAKVDVQGPASGTTTNIARAPSPGRTSTSRTRTVQSGSVSLASPTCGCVRGSCRVTSDYGPRRRPNRRASSFHQGLDIGGGAGTPIVAAESGTIVSAGRNGGYGNLIDIDHGGGYKTRYAHLSRFERRSGWVQQGEVIGYMGSTGNVTGPHLHFEVFRNGDRVDPERLVGRSGRTFSQNCQAVRSAGRAEERAEGRAVL